MIYVIHKLTVRSQFEFEIYLFSCKIQENLVFHTLTILNLQYVRWLFIVWFFQGNILYF